MNSLHVWLLCGIFLPVVFGDEMNLVYHLQEEQSNGTKVGNIATDSKLYALYTQERFQRLKYSIFTKGNLMASKFTVDQNTSTLTTSEKLDREGECPSKSECKLSLDLGVFENHPETNLDDLIKIIRLSIFLDDVNDNRPTFPSAVVTLTVPESVPVKHVLLTSGAIDQDTGKDNSVKSYELTPKNGLFGLQVMANPDGTSDLGIEVKHSLDRETRDYFQLVVVAKDGGNPQKSGSVKINIKVTDVNDNRPLFISSAFNETIPENVKVRATILRLSANDADADLNGELLFHFSSRTSEKIRNLLAINESTGELYAINEIDYEMDKQFQFLVEVKDKGTPSLSSQAAVILNIADINDNAPQIIINLPPSGRDISEAAEVGTFIAHVSVFDPDSGSNGEVTCSIPDDHFLLEKFSDFNYYKILLQKTLDREFSPTHLVNVTCEDKGDTVQRNSSAFTVRVMDVNDNAPKFSQNILTSKIYENNKVGDVFLTLSAKDADGPENNVFTYAITQDQFSMFNVDRFSGDVRATKVYDRETQPVLEFHVMAIDSRNHLLNSTATVIVTVSDQNDQPPQFTKPHFYFHVLENELESTVVGKINATDLDAVDNFLFSFSNAANISDYFTLDSRTGVIRTTRKLNREIRKKYQFGVLVADPDILQFRDTANVTVYIIDGNDNAPEFIFPHGVNSTKFVPYDKAVGSVITVILAQDNDTADNGKITYTIEEGNGKHLFFLNMMSGELIISMEMSKDDTGSYQLLVAARDGGTPQLTSHARLTIVVTEKNDTGGPAKTEARQYIAIVITLVCVTVVLCVAVVITICIIKKIDKERRDNMKEKMERQHTYENTADKIERVIPPASYDDNEIEKLKKKIKREISFTIDDDTEPLDTSELTTGTSFTTFKNLTSYSSIDQKLLSTPQACSSVLTNNTMTPEHVQLKMSHYADKKQEINRLASDRLQQHEQQQQQKHHKYPNVAPWLAETETALKRAEDATSEMSGGAETTDSGRGGSEDDVHSNKESTIPHSDSEECKQLSPRSYRDSRSVMFKLPANKASHDTTESTVSQISSQSAINPVSSQYPRNISFSDDSVTANTTVDTKPKLRRNSENVHTIPSLQSMSQTPYQQRGMNYRRYPSPDTTYRGACIDVTQSTVAMPYSLVDLDDALSESIAGTRDDDEEDRTTTTSGSYTINAEELCNEIDQLFFQDVIV